MCDMLFTQTTAEKIMMKVAIQSAGLYDCRLQWASLLPDTKPGV
jgi:hypothetical protein